ncbi:MAG TPA: NADH-quinone oxidoreductase subunit NuoB [Candidatus Omnitrophota bacterium]|nr:NADH-quinone oxidoreductase subunit NuoB [Candidatus Omnitrophota bacterium]
MLNMLKNRLFKGVALEKDKEIESLGRELKRQITNKFGRSFSFREVDTGSCGACDSEIIAATNPIYDIQRFGVHVAASPRHADALLITGPVSRNMLLALKETWEATPAPKYVITVGDCARGGGLFRDSYYTENGADAVLKVDLHIPGCPPTPKEIIVGLLTFLKSL